MQEELNDIYDAILDGMADETVTGVEAALAANIPAETVLKEGMIVAMTEVGALFEAGEYYVPEMLVAARAMKSGLKLLQPLLVEADVEPAGTVVIGTVQGDLHDIGKNLVSMMLEGAGFEVIDLGTDVKPAAFVEAAQGENVDILAMSALLTTTMPQMKRTIDALDAAGVSSNISVMIGGAPVTENFAKEIGATGYGADASQAAALATSLVA